MPLTTRPRRLRGLTVNLTSVKIECLPFHQFKEELDEAHTKEMDAFKEALEREKSRVLALEAVQVSMQTAHRDIVSRMQENFDQEMEGVRNKVDSAHGEQVQELQSLLEERHKMVGREISVV